MSKKNQQYLIIGAGSGVGRSIAFELAQEGYDLIITSRDSRDINSVSNDLMCRFENINVIPKTLDLMIESEILFFLNWLIKNNTENLIGVYCVAGYSTKIDQGVTQSTELINLLIDSNYKGVLKLLNPITDFFEKRNFGLITVISSIAVAAPRGNNNIYGSAKAALEYYYKSLQHYFNDTPINIQIYALGYIDTSLSYEQKLKLPVITPYKAAKKIVKNKNKKVETVQYIPYYWYFIVLLLRHMPWFIYKKMKF